MSDETFIRVMILISGFLSGAFMASTLIGWAARQVLTGGRWVRVINKVVVAVSGKSVL